MRVLPLTIVVFFACEIALAQSNDSMQLAEDLGSVLASEAFCGLQYDQEAIRQFVQSHVRADDMGFNNMLGAETWSARHELEQMSPSLKTAHCAQTERVARSYKFIK